MGNSNQPASQLTHTGKKSLDFPLHVCEGGQLIKMIGVRSTGTYDKFKGGDFVYVYESITRENGVKCRFVIKSNMPLDDVLPPAVNVHLVQLEVYQVDQLDQAKLLLSVKTKSTEFWYNFNQLEENRSKIAEINSLVGIGKLSTSDRASWEIIVSYLELSLYFGYYSLVPESKNTERFKNSLSVCTGTTAYGKTESEAIYNISHTLIAGLNSQYSWERTDISKYPFVQGIEYQGDELKYVEVVDRNRGQITMTFNHQILFRATYPFQEKEGGHETLWKSHIYFTGMIYEIDNRHPRHPVYNFVRKLVQLVLGNSEDELEFTELESEWFALCKNNLLTLITVFNLGEYFHRPSLNLERALKDSSTFSDVIFEVNNPKSIETQL